MEVVGCGVAGMFESMVLAKLNGEWKEWLEWRDRSP